MWSAGKNGTIKHCLLGAYPGLASGYVVTKEVVMKTWLIILACFFSVLTTTQSDARRTYLTSEQKLQLAKVQTVFANVIALTEKGRQDATPLLKIVKARMEEIGYGVVIDRKESHDVEFKVKCEERKTWTGTTPAGGDAELADAPSRLWKGPACILTYKLDGKDLDWYKEVRTTFENAIEATKQANAGDPGAYALKHLQQRLSEYDFPILLAAEWGQIERLLKVLDDPKTNKLRKVKILSILSEVQAEEALPRLTQIMKDKDLQKEAISAMAGTGADSIPLLIDLFQTSKQSPIRAAAAKALGNVAASTGDSRTIPPLINYLERVLPNLKTSEDIDFPVLTEVVWSVGKLRDERSIVPMAELQSKIWLIYDNSAEMKELREATNWSYKQLDLDGHIS